MKLITSSTELKETYRLNISPIELPVKPPDEKAKSIKYTFQNGGYHISVIQSAIEKGCSIIPANLKITDPKRKTYLASDFVSQRVMIYDIDSSKPDPETGIILHVAPTVQVMKRALFFFSPILSPYFYYPSFSHRDEAPRYRIAFLMKDPITNLVDLKMAHECFKILLGWNYKKDVDGSGTSSEHLFYGTNKGFTYFPDYKEIEIKDLLEVTLKKIYDDGKVSRHEKRNIKSFMKFIPEKYRYICKDYLEKYVSPIFASEDLKDINKSTDGDCGEEDIVRKSEQKSKQKYKTSADRILLDETELNKQRLNIESHKLAEVCLLMRDFLGGIEIDRGDRRIIMSNLIQIRGGDKLYCDLANGIYDEFDNEKSPIDELNDYKNNYTKVYGCQNCSYFMGKCPTEDRTIIEREYRFRKQGYLRVHHNRETVDINVLRGDKENVGILKDYIFNKCNSEADVLIVDCGVGKTETIQYVENGFLIATLLNETVLQIVNNRKSKGMDTIYFPDLKSYHNDAMKSALDVGNIDEYNRLIKREAINYEMAGDPPWGWGEEEERKTSFITYHHARKRLEKEDLTAVVTIERLLELDSTNNRRIICDESPLDALTRTYVFTKDKVEQFFVNQYMLKNLRPRYPELWEFILAIKEGITVPVIAKATKDIIFEDVQFWNDNKIKIFEILNATDFKVLSNDHILCFRKRNLPSKVTITSATLLEDTAKLLFRDKINDLNYHDFGSVNIKANITQYIDDSFSRSQLDPLSREGEEGIKKLYKILDDHKGWNFITFKDTEGLLIAKGIPPEHIMHFGAVHGKNKFSGNNLCVIGADFPSPIKVRNFLWGMGLDCPEDVDKIGNAGFKVVEMEGFLRRLYVGNNSNYEIMYKQFLYDSTLQAIGRARPIDNAVEIHVYNNLYLSNAKFITNKKIIRW